MKTERKIVIPDYKNSIYNIIRSVMLNYGIDVDDTHKLTDEILAKDYKNVVVMLFDGMGVSTLNNLDENSFMRRHVRSSVTSVFPSTTTAALTTMRCGLSPVEHGWLGWNQYLKEFDYNGVTLLPNFIMGTNKMAADYHVGEKHLPFVSVFEKIMKKGYRVNLISQHTPDTFSTTDELISKVRNHCLDDEKKCIFTYYDEPDSSSHKKGCNSKAVKELLEGIDRELEKYLSDLEDTVIIILADHGHTDVKHLYIEDHKELVDMLVRKPTLEPRAAAFYVKQGRHEEFEAYVKEHFGNFLILSKDEVIERKLFGPGKMHERFEEFIGDYMLISRDEYCIQYERKPNEFLSSHAGITEEEMMIPLIVIESK